MYNFCTLFDIDYLPLGLALYYSLRRSTGENNFVFWVLCMDSRTSFLLKKMDLPGVRAITLKEFENKDLKQVKQDRTSAEYCWTCSSNLMKYIFDLEPRIENLCYLDADIYFFSDIKPIFDELKDYSILITPHRFSWRKRVYEKEAGKYNVSLVWVKNDKIGQECIKEWSENCLKWCYNRYEDGKYGDQLYLNIWPKKYEKVMVLKNIGGGVAPWNVERYRFSQMNNMIYVNSKKLIFYHFHQFRANVGGELRQTKDYELSQSVTDIIYKPYELEVKKNIERIRKYE